MILYYNADGFHRKPVDGAYETTSEYRQELCDYINNHSNREDVFRVVPDENGKPIVIEIELDLSISLRFKRKRCFGIINRGPAWYNTLTEQQKNELQSWYQAWLDVTDTLIEPVDPTWLS